jgi:hypothetical protein
MLRFMYDAIDSKRVYIDCDTERDIFETYDDEEAIEYVKAKARSEIRKLQNQLLDFKIIKSKAAFNKKYV